MEDDYFQLSANLFTLGTMAANLLRKIRKRLNVRTLIAAVWSNKKLSAALALGFLLLLYVLFNNKGVFQRIQLERQRSEMIEKIRQAEAEQKKLQRQSKALDSDKREIEKVAREKYGMVRPGEKVYRVAPKK